MVSRFLSSFFLLNFSGFLFAQSEDARTVVNNVLDALKKAKGYTYIMRGTERIAGKQEYRVTEVLTKVNINPKKIYTKVLNEPNKGTEMLYVNGERDNKVLVKAGFLPNLKLSPTSSLLCKEQHHSVLSSGFGFFFKNISAGVKRADEQDGFNTVFKLDGEVNFEGRKCYKLIVEDPTYEIKTYTAQKGETPFTLSQKLLIPEFAIQELNGIKNIDDDLGGKTLKIPTSYARKSIIYIDKANYHPIYQEMHDNKGMFEKYEFYNLKLSPNFADDEFTSNFSEYNF